MKSVLFPSTLFAIALALIASAPAAQAGDRSGVNWSVNLGTGPAVVYAPPPAVYAYPQPVYVRPQPVYVEPAPVVVYGAPGYVQYGQPYYYGEAPRHRHHHHDRGYNGDNFRQGNWGYRDRD